MPKPIPGSNATWGAGTPQHYGGSARVMPTDDGSLLVVTLHLDDGDYVAVNRELGEMVREIKRIVEGGRR